VVLILLFSALIAFGAAGNGLVCYVVLANERMRTPRNLLILNLAASDLILCLFTQPFNLMKVTFSLVAKQPNYYVTINKKLIRR